MGLLRRFGGAMVLLLSAVGIVCCVAGVIGIWAYYQTASEKVHKIADALDAGLRRVSAANQKVQRAVGKARAAVAEVRNESADLAAGGEKSRVASRAVRSLVQKKVGPNIDDLGGRLVTMSDAAIAVSALLESFQGPASSRSGRVTPDQLERWAGEAQQLSANLRRLESAIDDGDREAGGREVAAATNEVDLVLERCQARVDQWQSDLDGAQEELPRLKAGLLRWLMPAAIAATLLCVWVAAGQVSLFAHALAWCRGA